MSTKANWVITPGRTPGEIGYCTRCNAGLSGCNGQLLDVAVAMMRAFVKVHARCKESPK